MNSLKASILAAARAEHIPKASAGLWTVHKYRLSKPLSVVRDREREAETLPPGTYTQLFRITDATVHNGMGELVMDDTPSELNKHLEFMLRASGRVLVTGLGLGCVVRGLLANPAVKFVVVIERDASVLKLVGPHMPTQRLSIVHADAMTWVTENKGKFDCAWHDIWTDEAAGEPHLQVNHMRLINAMNERVKFQGAWNFPKYFRRIMPEQFGDL